MVNIAVRRIFWIAVVWAGWLGCAQPTVASLVEGVTSAAASAGIVAADAVNPAAAPDPGGNYQSEIVLEDRDALDPDGASSAGLEDPPPSVVVGAARRECLAAAGSRCLFQSALLVEPRLLRYCRLLF